jgi:hypothetical protein
MKETFKSTNRRKDYIAHLAYILFAIIILLELLMVTWLPSQLQKEKLWDREVSLQEMIDLEDFLRRYIRGDVKYKNNWEEGEGFLAMSVLDILAKYIRDNQKTMTREQIREIYNALLKYEEHYKKWNKRKFNIIFEEIKTEPVLNQQMREYQKWEKTKKTNKESN